MLLCCYFLWLRCWQRAAQPLNSTKQQIATLQVKSHHHSPLSLSRLFNLINQMECWWNSRYFMSCRTSLKESMEAWSAASSVSCHVTKVSGSDRGCSGLPAALCSLSADWLWKIRFHVWGLEGPAAARGASLLVPVIHFPWHVVLLTCWTWATKSRRRTSKYLATCRTDVGSLRFAFRQVGEALVEFFLSLFDHKKHTWGICSTKKHEINTSQLLKENKYLENEIC